MLRGLNGQMIGNKLSEHVEIFRGKDPLKHYRNAFLRRLIRTRLKICKNRQMIFNLYRDVKVLLRSNDHLSLWAYMFGLDKKMIITLENILKPGNIVIDIGAHKGLYSLICSRLVGDKGKVFSFEPVPALLRGLRENVALNKIENIMSFENAVGKENGKAAFYISKKGGDEWSSLYRWNLARNRANDVHVIKIDDWAEDNCIKKIDLIKVDAEGSEIDVIIGAEKTLRRGKIKAIIMEFNPETQMAANRSCRELYESVEAIGYRWYELPFMSGREIDGRVEKLNGLCDLIAISQAE